MQVGEEGRASEHQDGPHPVERREGVPEVEYRYEEGEKLPNRDHQGHCQWCTLGCELKDGVYTHISDVSNKDV